MLYAARQQPSEINLAFYLTYPAVLIVLFLFIGAIELVALVLRLSLLRKS
jgi:general stress protein CsbA